ncbi:hypothetical protein FH972_020966 [Carpinus fangiana]|uniref:Cytochrome c domain-containing protein n=1 Tax=Carpinus fangiana TaxID=176857 RepID=A0A5N6KNJ2_9ROSI|nr:hypothetical protein FH972_020966 [Carpinus fangiana]
MAANDSLGRADIIKIASKLVRLMSVFTGQPGTPTRHSSTPPHLHRRCIRVAQDARQRFASSSSDAAASQWRTTVAAYAATGVAIGSTSWYYFAFGRDAYAMTPQEEGLHAIQYPWEHQKWNKTFDHQALRRGFQVYREVCSSCHSLSRIPYRSLVGSLMTVDEAKAMAEELEYDTEPNDEGEIEQRPGKLSDYLQAPYKNDEAARAANNGALPPDLSLMVKARHGGCNYIFSLLTGYPEENPAGVQIADGLNFNPYFPGGGIAMARVLYDGLVEYEDKTPATTSQMAKDVVEFLNWTAEPEMDERKKMGWKVLTVLSVLTAMSIWIKRYKWAPIKSRKIIYNPPVDRKTLHPSTTRPRRKHQEVELKQPGPRTRVHKAHLRSFEELRLHWATSDMHAKFVPSVPDSNGWHRNVAEARLASLGASAVPSCRSRKQGATDNAKLRQLIAASPVISDSSGMGMMLFAQSGLGITTSPFLPGPRAATSSIVSLALPSTLQPIIPQSSYLSIHIFYSTPSERLAASASASACQATTQLFFLLPDSILARCCPRPLFCWLLASLALSPHRTTILPLGSTTTLTCWIPMTHCSPPRIALMRAGLRSSPARSCAQTEPSPTTATPPPWRGSASVTMAPFPMSPPLSRRCPSSNASSSRPSVSVALTLPRSSWPVAPRNVALRALLPTMPRRSPCLLQPRAPAPLLPPPAQPPLLHQRPHPLLPPPTQPLLSPWEIPTVQAP